MLVCKTSHRPHGKLTFARCLQGGGVYVTHWGPVTLSSSTISGNTAYSVRAHLHKSSHRPDGKDADTADTLRLDSCLLFAGWRCLCQFRHSLNHQLPSVFQSSHQCACSCSRVPIAPLASTHACTTANKTTLRSTSGGACHRDLENFLSPPHGRLTFCALFCRAAVSMSIHAIQAQSR